MYSSKPSLETNFQFPSKASVIFKVFLIKLNLSKQCIQYENDFIFQPLLIKRFKTKVLKIKIFE